MRPTNGRFIGVDPSGVNWINDHPTGNPQRSSGLAPVVLPG
ncbi:hypothetical protein ACFYXS_37390 [Streptomyces sp. NPDC002574]